MTESWQHQIPPHTFGEFLVHRTMEMATGGLISKEEFDNRRQRQVPRRADGSEKKQFQDLNTEDKLDYLYNTGQQTQRDVLQNSVRLYGVKKNDAKGVHPTEILRRICDEGLKLPKTEVDLICTSGLRFIQRVESGKCIVFQLNRVDLIRKIFEKIGNLKDYQNPYNNRAKIVFTRNLCPEDNKIRSECLSAKELLKEKGFRDIKIRFNKLISVNGGPFHEYTWYLEHKYEEANRREEVASERQGSSQAQGASGQQQQQGSYASVVKKRKGRQPREENGETGDGSSNSSPAGSGAASGSNSPPKKQRTKKSRH